MKPVEDLEAFGLKGPVWKEVTEHSMGDRLYAEEHFFDRDGRLLRVLSRIPEGKESVYELQYGPNGERLDRNIRIVRNENGSRTETQDISKLGTWSMNGLHHIAFGTKGAFVAQTSFDRDGVPLETVLEGDDGSELSRIRYVCDEMGNILEAIQHSGSDPWPPGRAWAERASAAEVEEALPFLEPGIEQFRAVFRYDGAGRVLEQETHFSGKLLHRTVTTYNAQGDMLTQTADNQEPVRYVYEYDNWNNWIQKTALHSAISPVEYRRSITYYVKESKD